MPPLPRGASVVAPVFVALLATACLFPEYTFDEAEPSGGTGGTPTTGGQPAGGEGGAGGEQLGGGGEGGEGGAPPVEDCFTAGDEDNDGSADCADSDCNEDLECVDAIPVGWGTFGYAALFRGGVASDPACPAGTTNEVYSGNTSLTNTDAECAPCDCGAPMGRGCELLNDFDANKAGVQGFYTRDVVCGNPTATNQTTLTVPVPWDGTCSGLDVAAGGGACPGPNCNASVRVQAANVTGGSCTPTGGEPSGGDPTWGEHVKACEATELTGCDTGQTCIVRPASPYEGRVCIGKAGDQACPAGEFSQKTPAYGDFVDDRSCSTCMCGNPSGGSCRLRLTLYTDAVATTCSSTSNPPTVESGQCIDLVGNPRISGRRSQISQAPTGGSCAVTGGGEPSGEATPSVPTTFCCLPE